MLDSCDYQPSQVAKGLATRQSRCVAVMTLDIRDVHHAAIAYEIERTMASRRVQHHPVQPGQCTTTRAGEYSAYAATPSRSIGVFFVGSSIRDTHSAQPSTSPNMFTNIPILFANAVLPLPNAYGVLSDEEDGTFYHAVKRLATRPGGATLPLSMDGETRE